MPNSPDPNDPPARRSRSEGEQESYAEIALRSFQAKLRVEKQIDSTTDPNDPALGRYRPDGQQEKYFVLSEAERKKGFQRPVRLAYRHLACGTVTTMSEDIAETYARDPKIYGGTFCCGCGKHFRLIDSNGGAAFVWVPDGSAVGS